MSTLTIILTGIGLSMDAFAVSLSKGFCLRKNIFRNALKISIFFGISQAVMPLIGWLCGIYFEGYIKFIDHWIAFILLSLLGGKMIYESLKEENPETAVECSLDEEDLKNKDLLVLAIATSIDALAVGISFAFLNVNIISSIAIIGIITFIVCFAGVYLGKALGNILKKYSEIIGGVILIFIGFKILIEHLFF